MIGHDLRQAWRSWRRQPGVATLAVSTLAIGIGLNTAIFSSVESVLLRPLAFRDPERLVTLVQTSGGAVRGGVGAWTAREIASRSRMLQSVSAYDDAQATLVEDGQAEIVRGMRVSVDFFDTLGVPMALGRGFEVGEDRIARANVIVLTHTLWTNRFGADPNIIGRVLQLNGVPHRVIGVLSASFRPLRMTNPAETPTYYMPLIDSRSEPACRACVGTRAVARVQPGATLFEAQTEAGALMRALAKEYPHDYAVDTSIAVVPLRAALVDGVAPALWAVLGAVGLVLVIACANVASLQLARTTDRSREFAVRSALGASRRQIARGLLIESGILTVVGAAAGIAVGWAATRYAAALAPRELPRFDEVTLDARGLAFTIVISTVTAIAIGLLPAWSSARVDVSDALKRATDRTTSPRGRLRTAVIAVEIAMAFALVVATGLLVRTVVGLERVNAGFDAHNVLTLTPVGPRDSRADRLQYLRSAQAVDRSRAGCSLRRRRGSPNGARQRLVRGEVLSVRRSDRTPHPPRHRARSRVVVDDRRRCRRRTQHRPGPRSRSRDLSVAGDLRVPLRAARGADRRRSVAVRGHRASGDPIARPAAADLPRAADGRLRLGVHRRAALRAGVDRDSRIACTAAGSDRRVRRHVVLRRPANV